jgi:hypothetical protein
MDPIERANLCPDSTNRIIKPTQHTPPKIVNIFMEPIGVVAGVRRQP